MIAPYTIIDEIERAVGVALSVSFRLMKDYPNQGMY